MFQNILQLNVPFKHIFEATCESFVYTLYLTCLCNILLVAYSTVCMIALLLFSMQVAIMNGITMGGGAGLSVHGSFCIATEKTVCIIDI